jgi:hypothetical protein
VCGRSGILKGGYSCQICGRRICGAHSELPQTQIAIDQNVAIHLISNAPSSIQKENVARYTNNGCGYCMGVIVCPGCLSWLDYWSKDLHSYQQAAKRNYWTQQYMEEAKRLERSGRFEEAAVAYEKAEAWDDAGRVRGKGSTHMVKNVSVDLNQLVSQLRTGGLALTYKCTTCGANLMIGSGGIDAPKTCPYCSSNIDTELMSTLLRSALR